jgi:hypothetical protein
MKRFLNLSIAASWMLGLFLTACQPDQTAPSSSLPEKVDFNFHIKPILSDRCFQCHGPDEKAREGDFRLDVREAAFAALDSAGKYFAILPGEPEKSELVRRILHTDPDELMPPPESNLSLSEREIALLQKWITQGAEWKDHWAFIPPEKAALPAVSDPEWPINAIDPFILHRLEQEGLAPNEEASKEKLLRRLSFDLRGLPPSLAEIEAFLQDDSPEAYEQWVDRFLSEQSYGERMSMEWLDLARYADSHGYQDDLERSMWPWRDWVIDAFNDNLPYDRFVSWQLAGDLLPDATYEQKLATGFNRNHKITQEVGVIDEEYRVNYVLDRVNTFSTAFLGLTVECAQCHDHKYDPISQKEYYRLFSFFNQVPEKGRVDYGVEVAEPYLPLPEEKAENVRRYLRQLMAETQAQYTSYIRQQQEQDQVMPARSAEDMGSLPEGLVAWYPLDYLEEGQIREELSGELTEAGGRPTLIQGQYGGGLEFMGTNYADLKPSRDLNFNQPFTISFWLNNLDDGMRGVILSAKSSQRTAKGDRRPSLSLRITNDKNLNLYLGNAANQTALRIETQNPLPGNQWLHVAVAYDGSGQIEGLSLFLNGTQIEDLHLQNQDLRGRIQPTEDLYLAITDPEKLKKGLDERSYFSGNVKGLEAGQIDELAFFDRVLAEEEIRSWMRYNPISALLAQADKTDNDRKRLFFHQLLNHDPQFQSLTERLREYRIREGRLDDIVLKPTMIMSDMDTVRPTYVLDRGQYDARGEVVEPSTPAAVLSFPGDLPSNRLGLAQWLFDPQNPLTARVAVNRYWQMIFGRGLVATPEDFGSQGELPSHPALLDWLAVDFMEADWDLKRLLKQMVMSATYRQSVISNPRLQQKDPENIYYARGPQMRLPAEMVRDHALAISGLLSEQKGGPSVKPYQPPGLWLQVASGNQALRKYIQDHGAELYRRSLYTFWKRTLPPPSMLVFDAPSREQCVIERRATSTPMQALVLLNDPQFTEASRLLATRMLQEGGETAEERIRFAFRLATSRVPQDKELDLLSELLELEKNGYDKDLQAARELLAIGEYPMADDLDLAELAAYTVLANAILNLVETISKG